jgi:uncharacterized membrane protein YfcA
VPPGLFGAELALAAACALAAGLMRGFTGFGSAMLMMPVYGLLFGPVQAVATVMLMETAVTLQLLPGALPRTRWREIGPMGLAALVGTPIGGYLILHMDAEIMRRVIAGVVLVFTLVMLRGWRYRGPRGRAATIGAGLASGLMTTSVGMGGPPVLLYLLSGADAAAQNRANVITFLAIVGAAALVVYLVAGVIGGETVWRAALLALPFLAAAFAGGRFFRRSGERLYRRVALYFLLAVALGSLVV